MVWAVKFNQDTDVRDLGTVTAYQDSFSYSRRVDTTNIEDVDAYVEEVLQKYGQNGTERDDSDSKARAILAKIQGA